MKALFAVNYSSALAAREGIAVLGELEEGEAIAILDAALIARAPDGSVSFEPALGATFVGALSGAAWGALIGLVVRSPFMGAAIGAAAGALKARSDRDGLSSAFLRRIARRLPVQSWTLFVLASSLAIDKVADALAPLGGDVVYTSLSGDEEKAFARKFEHAAAFGAETEPFHTEASPLDPGASVRRLGPTGADLLD